jgi:hypothetical protein
MGRTGISIDDVRNDWQVLDGESFTMPDEVKLISHEKFTGESEIARSLWMTLAYKMS